MSSMAAQSIADLYHNRVPAGCIVNDAVLADWRW
jgi:hypothetical protein